MKKPAAVLSIVSAGALALSALPATAGVRHTPPAPAASQTVATLYRNETTYKRPDGARAGSVSDHRPITGERTVLPVLRTVTQGRSTWLLVRLPGRPNSHTGWIHAAHTKISQVSWHIVVSLGPKTKGFSRQRKVFVYHHGHLVRSWLIVDGSPGNLTPTGKFFVEENIFEGHGTTGGPYALATSARSNSSEFPGGQIALHGMDGGLQAKPGTAASHGCVRMLGNEITWLSERIPNGTPVTLFR